MASLLDTLKAALGTAQMINRDAFLAALAATTDGTVEANKAIVADSNKDVTGLRNLAMTGTLTVGGSDLASVKGIHISATVAVTVPSIANDAAENGDSVAVDVSAALTMQPAVGDAVIAIPLEALPTDCLFAGAIVTNTDEVTLSFVSKEGGSGVTGAAKNFKFLVIDLT